jgi:uncharacterized repeat protein (TIGR03806 family)
MFALVLALLVGSTRQVWTAAAGEQTSSEKPAAVLLRARWPGSAVVGSPDPPLPYAVEPTLTKVKWQTPLFVVEEPDADALLVVSASASADVPSRLLRISNDAAASETSVVLEMPGRLLYSVCFDPDFKANGHVYLFSNGPTGQPQRKNRVARFTLPRGTPRRIDPASEELILEWASAGHDGGDLVFGNDGMLYIAAGDGSSDSDTLNSGQTVDDLLGAVLRIDVRRRAGEQGYAVPPDNPLVGVKGARGEIWAYGLRNPWRLCVDRRTGHLWVGNNGQDLWEMAHLVRRGENYGWSVYEGSHPFYLGRQLGPTPAVAPTIEHSHADFRSLTGGVVYYGDKLAELNGAYIYGDYSSGRIWGMKYEGERVVWHRELADTALQIAAFQVDRRGELLVVDHGGGIYRLVPAPALPTRAPFPLQLSQSGLFSDVSKHAVTAGLTPYSVNLPGWHDGARAEHWLAVRDGQTISYSGDQSWTLPDGSLLMQTLSLPSGQGSVESWRRIETRILVRLQGEWIGYSYVWNDEQTDARLAPREGVDLGPGPTSDPPAEGPPPAWRVPSRAECMTCHSRAAGFLLGINDAQLNREQSYPAGRGNQLLALSEAGYFSAPLPKPPEQCGKLPGAQDASAELEPRVRAYLHVNCSMCHVAAGGGNAQMDLLYSQSRDATKLLGARPQHDTFGIENAMLVAPGDPDRSVLLRRMGQRGRGQMPPLVTRRVDRAAVDLFRRWIGQLQPARPFVRRWTVSDLAHFVDDSDSVRSAAAGKKVFHEIGCVQCHRIDGEGGSVGPDLSGIGRRPPREVLESIVEPGKVIADAYASWLIQTAEGETLSGRIEQEDEHRLLLRLTGSLEPAREIRLRNVEARRRLESSNMPAGIIDVLTKDEVLDLLAYLRNNSASGAPAGQ